MKSRNSGQSEVDVLVIGAGPAGLALANWFRNTDIRVHLIDQKPGPTLRGQAEGLKSTTIEMLESFGIGPQIWMEAIHIEEIAIWGIDPAKPDRGIVREQIIADKVEELGKTREMTLQQSRIEHHMLENILSSSNITIQRSTQPSNLKIDHDFLQDPSAHPFTFELEPSNCTHEAQQISDTKNENLSIARNPSDHPNNAQPLSPLHAKYIVGCDGARSWTRKQLGINLEGDRTDSVFGVVDIVPKTNFPDIRKCNFLKTPDGVIMTVPRANREIRLYIPVEKGSVLSDPQTLTFETIMTAARKIIAPYTLEAASCSWWSAYRVGQRVGDHFAAYDRAFLAGDAVHTHSPKAGQGMNTSIQDSCNLGWKLRLVLQGHAKPSILSTYESERCPIAQDLIAFDKGYLKLFSSSSSTFDSQMLSGLKFTTGLSIRYPISPLVQLGPEAQSHQTPSQLKADLVPGKRLPDFQAVYQADGRTTRIHPRLAATGMFRILIFSGDITDPTRLATVKHLVAGLTGPEAGLGDLTRGGDRAKVEVLLIHSAPLNEVDHLGLPAVLVPWCEEYGYDYYRVLADVESAHEGHGRAYERLQIDPGVGCCVVVRPDGYVGAITGLDGVDEIGRYFAKIFV